MPNMTYCMFENTCNDLRQCTSTMEEAFDLEDLDLSGSELRSLKQMRELCAKFLEESDRLLQTAASTDCGDIDGYVADNDFFD